MKFVLERAMPVDDKRRSRRQYGTKKVGKCGKDFPTLLPFIVGWLLSVEQLNNNIVGYVPSVQNYSYSFEIALLLYGTVVSALLSFSC